MFEGLRLSKDDTNSSSFHVNLFIFGHTEQL